jgi:GcrA cell cycle regulator
VDELEQGAIMARFPEWTDKRTAMLRDLHEQGLSFSDIADKLGVKRNACIGKAHRLGLAARPARDYSGAPAIQAAPPPVGFAEPVTLMGLQSHHCRWPIGDPGLFCGAVKQDGSSYCPEHRRIGRRVYGIKIRTM